MRISHDSATVVADVSIRGAGPIPAANFSGLGAGPRTRWTPVHTVVLYHVNPLQQAKNINF